MVKIIVIGGGAAGMMAAISAAGRNTQVILLDKNEKLGKKLFITGKGRCNVTNTEPLVSTEQANSYVISNSKFLYSAYAAFPNTSMMELLETAGCPLKVERGGRVFPASDHSYDVIGALRKELERKKVIIRYRCKVNSIQTEAMETAKDSKKQKATQRIIGVRLENGESLKADAVIVATGGLSYPSTGSTGDGYELVKKLGHQMTGTYPALVPFEIIEEWCQELQGLSLKNVELTLFPKDKPSRTIYQGFGEMLFTHFGVSGPLILSASSYYQEYCRKGKKWGDVSLSLNLKPALDEETLDKRLQRELEMAGNKQFRNAIMPLFPSKIIPVMINLSGIPGNKQANEITKEERKNFGYLMQHLTMTIAGVRGFEEAIITSGGVSVKDVTSSTMESKRIEGLYFAGEVLDVDALTGGFNLQIAWSTGYLAGLSAARRQTQDT
jgi:predicted Rossmann fold flavoprotein